MPGTLGQLRRNRRRIDIPLDAGNSIYIIYRPGSLTEGLRLEYEAAQDEAIGQWQKAAVVRHYLLTIIEEWDVVDNQGIIPLTDEAFRERVGYEDQVEIARIIQEDADMGEAHGATPLTPLPSDSVPAAKQATSRRKSPTGTR